MRTWNMTITETLARTVTVEAEDAASAEDVVRGMYDRCEIVLAAEDISGTEITAGQEDIYPLCGAGIEYKGENVIDDDGGTFPWTCPGCGASGKEVIPAVFPAIGTLLEHSINRRAEICAD